METIVQTGFLAPGYALLEVMVVATIGLLFVAKFKSAPVERILTVFIPLVYVYMLRLIRDIDNPFQLNVLGAAEVDPAPLLAYRDRLQSRIESESVQPKVATA